MNSLKQSMRYFFIFLFFSCSKKGSNNLHTPIIEKVKEDAPIIEKVKEDAPIIEKIKEDAPIIEKIKEDAPIIENVLENLRNHLFSLGLKFKSIEVAKEFPGWFFVIQGQDSPFYLNKEREVFFGMHINLDKLLNLTETQRSGGEVKAIIDNGNLLPMAVRKGSPQLQRPLSEFSTEQLDQMMVAIKSQRNELDEMIKHFDEERAKRIGMKKVSGQRGSL
ncbi:MAG: hypothetical protein PHY93_04955 [Bacteriovorax sp.]|nr:hypothetical protein [Bacteriovorax sp.]